MSTTEGKKQYGRNILKITQKACLQRSNLENVFSGSQARSEILMVHQTSQRSVRREWRPLTPWEDQPLQNELRA